ncbi:hypothetical protein AAHA92_14813 [Salvia divinorum]|uniref:Uncharacterized protein n=1 Tax=Salvia divinorum TaxID=28513 RepID=A0ABD1HCV1_SALDI
MPTRFLLSHFPPFPNFLILIKILKTPSPPPATDQFSPPLQPPINSPLLRYQLPINSPLLRLQPPINSPLLHHQPVSLSLCHRLKVKSSESKLEQCSAKTQRVCYLQMPREQVTIKVEEKTEIRMQEQITKLLFITILKFTDQRNLY